MYLKNELYARIQSDESIFDFIQESSLDGLWYWDLETPENEWMNSRFWTVLGYNPDEMPHKSAAWKDIINQDDLKVAYDNFIRHCEDPGHPYDQIVRYTHKNGSTVWIRCRGMAIRDNTGKPIRMMGAHLDVTELKRKEEELYKAKEIAEESENKFRTLSENSPAIIYRILLKPSLKFVYISPVVTDITGYTPEDYYADPDLAFKQVHPDDRIILEKAIHNSQGEPIVLRWVNKDGKIIWTEQRNVLIFDAEGNPVAFEGIAIDITLQKEAEIALRMNEDLLNASQRLSKTGGWVWKAETNAMYWTEETYRIHDITPGEIQPGSAEHIKLSSGCYRPEDRPVIMAAFQRCKKEGQPYDLEFPFTSVKGRQFWIRTSAQPVIENGKTISIIGNIIDINELKKAEQELIKAKELVEKSEMQARDILQTAMDGFWMVDTEGWFIDVSQVACNLLGYSREEMLTMRISDIENEETAEQTQLHLQKVIETGEDRFETKHRRKDGTIIDVDVSIKLQPSQNLMVVFVSDITERKKAEAEHLKFLTITEKALFGSAICDPDGLILYVNQYFAQKHGYSTKELIGKNIAIFHSEQQLPLVRAINEEAFGKGIVESVEVQHLHKNGHEFTMIMSVVVVKDEHNNPRYLAATAFDITHQKGVEQNLQNLVNDQNIMLDNDPTLIFFKDCENNIIRVTESVAAATGMTREEIEGCHSKEIYPEMADQYWEDDLEVIRTGNPKLNIIEPLHGADGSIHWLLTNKIPVKNSSGEIAGISVFSTDISKLKKAEDDLIQRNDELVLAKEKAEENELQFRSIFESAADAIFIADAENGIIVNANNAAVNLLNIPIDEIIGKHQRELHPPEMSDYSQASFQKQKIEIIEEKLAFPVENYVLRSDGTQIPVEVTGSRVLYKGRDGIMGIFRDISERKHAETELKNSREASANLNTLLNAILESPLDMVVFALDNKFCYTAFTKEHKLVMKRLWGVDIKVGVNMLDYIGRSEDRKKAQNSFRRCLQGEFFILEEEYGDSSLQRKYYETRYSPLFNELKEIIGLTVFNIDITQRKQTEHELIKAKEEAERNEQKYRMLFNLNRDSISLLGIDADGKPTGFIDFNNAACDIFGFSREELMLMKIEELEEPVPDNVMSQRLETLQTKGSVDFETIITDKAGNKRYMEVKVILINYQNQPALMNITREITERKKAEQQIIAAKEHAENNNRINEARLKLLKYSENHTIDEILEETLNTAELISNSKIGFFHFVEHDQNNLLLQNWSTGTKNNYCKAQGHGMHYQIDKAGVWVDCVSERKPVIHNNYEALKHKKGLPEGHATLIRELVIPIIYDDIVKAIFGIGNKETEYDQTDVENISLLAYLAWEIIEKKKISEELVFAKEKAEESDRLKSAFLANMSHEIRTPMNGILGFSELLKKPDLTGEQQQEYIRIIEKSGARMLNIINQIIDISKIESGLMKIDIQESNINEQIEYAYNFFKPEAEAKGIKLSFRNTLPAKEAMLQTDREKLYAILTNLVKNAIKYTKDGVIEFGYVSTGLSASEAQTGKATITHSKEGERSRTSELRFYVKDTGIGISKDRQEAIFERFIQADITDKMAYQGAGLGLAITKAYVEMLGGKIWVESEEGIGSTFYFTLPYDAKPIKETIDRQLEPSEKNNDLKKLKILIVEDDEVSEMLIDITVRMYSREILNAGTGPEAVKACRDNPDIDLILMDIQLPEMSGYEVVRKVREFNKEVIIIAQTAYGLSGDKEKAINAGCNDYIAKPINKNELLNLIQKFFWK